MELSSRSMSFLVFLWKGSPKFIFEDDMIDGIAKILNQVDNFTRELPDSRSN